MAALELDTQILKIVSSVAKTGVSASGKVLKGIFELLKQYQEQQKNNEPLNPEYKKINIDYLGESKDVTLNNSNIKDYQEQINNFIPILKENTDIIDIARINLLKEVASQLNVNIVVGKENDKFSFYIKPENIENVPKKSFKNIEENLEKLDKEPIQKKSKSAIEKSQNREELKKQQGITNNLSNTIKKSQGIVK